MNIVILLAAGKSQRAKQDKLWANVHVSPLWTLAYKTFQAHPEIHQTVLVVPEKDLEKFKEFTGPNTILVSGGATRMESFLKGLSALNLDEVDVVLDHNAASPKVTALEISQVISAAKEHGAAALSHPTVNTLVKEKNGFYVEELSRKAIRQMQTPQAVRADLLKDIDLKDQTDLATALLGSTAIKVVEAHPLNKKVTFEEDVETLATRAFLGEDSHAFSKVGTLKLGGLEVPELPALEANSDGDVVLHAIGRALAQAQGSSFSEIADALCKAGEKNSAAYLKPLLEDTHIQNVSLQIEAKQPHIDSLPLTNSLAKILNISEDRINISAMSGEGLTPFGRGEAIRCTALIQCL